MIDSIDMIRTSETRYWFTAPALAFNSRTISEILSGEYQEGHLAGATHAAERRSLPRESLAAVVLLSQQS